MEKKIASIIGIVLGIVIIIVGLCVQGISVDVLSSSIGRDIAFGADFYTEMYDVTRDVGFAINSAKHSIADAAESVCDAIGWLIVAIGLFDVAYFVCKMVSAEEDVSNNTYGVVSSIATPTVSSSMQSGAYPTTSLPLQPVEAPQCEPSVKQTPITEPQNNNNKKHATAEIVDGTKICPNCKLPQHANRTVCWQCGTKFDN